jgi:asparagine synthase (glutamine-hydrolysing)
MSFQFGIWNFDGEPVEEALLRQLAFRSVQPVFDAEAAVVEGPVAMLYRPLHSTTESRREHQPYLSDGGGLITWDGRLDNREELLGQLSHNLKDDETDIAIIAAAVDHWGESTFSRIVGDWAISIWNPASKELILARDYMGIRRLFYYPTKRRVIWSSQLEPLVCTGSQFQLCNEYIAGYLALYPEPDLTPYREIRSVAPGHLLKITNGRAVATRYWSFNPRIKIRYRTDAEYEEHYRHLFRQAVRRRLRTDSPILADLSGGFDSSSIICMADDIAAQEGINSPSLDTFSYHDSNEPENDDYTYVSEFERKRGKRGIHADLKNSEMPIKFECSMFSATPGFKQRTDVHAALSEILHRGGYKVILSGFGGDEINGQTLDPRVILADMLLNLRLGALAKNLTTWSLLIRKRPWIHLLLQTLRELAPPAIQARLKVQGKVERWVNSGFAHRYKMSLRQIGPMQAWAFSRPSCRDAAQTIDNLARQLNCSGPQMAEKRYPYLDQHFVEFLSAVPLDQLLRPGQRRSLMRRALAGILPSQILARKTKGVMVRCFSASLNSQWDTVEKALSEPLSSRMGYVEKRRLLEALTAMKNGQFSLQAIGVLNALSLEFWLRDVEARGLISIRPSEQMNRSDVVEATI